MSNSRAILPLLALPVLIGVLAGVGFYGLENVMSFFGVVGAIMAFLIVASKAAGWWAERGEAPETPLYSNGPLDLPMRGGSVTLLPGGHTRIDTKEGTSFLVGQGKGDTFFVQQIDPGSGRHIGSAFHGMNKYGEPDGRAVVQHIKRRTRGG